MLDLKEKASSLASSTLKKDNRLKSLEISMEQKREECVKLENQLKKVNTIRTYCTTQQNSDFCSSSVHLVLAESV